MKVLLCVALAVSVAAAQSMILTDDQKANWKNWRTECQQETGVSTDDIEKLKNNDFNFTDKGKIMAHGLCFAKKCGLAKPDGELDIDNLKSKLKRVVSNDQEVEKMVNDCYVKKSTPEETIFELLKCIHQGQPTFIPV